MGCRKQRPWVPTQYLHMVNPVIGQFQQGDARSGEVPVQPSTTNTVFTTVLVRDPGTDNSWWVLGRGTSHDQSDHADLERNHHVSSCFNGDQYGFRGDSADPGADDNNASLGKGYVTGGTTSMGPYSGSIAYAQGTTKYGAVVLHEPAQRKWSRDGSNGRPRAVASSGSACDTNRFPRPIRSCSNRARLLVTFAPTHVRRCERSKCQGKEGHDGPQRRYT